MKPIPVSCLKPGQEVYQHCMDGSFQWLIVASVQPEGDKLLVKYQPQEHLTAAHCSEWRAKPDATALVRKFGQ